MSTDYTCGSVINGFGSRIEDALQRFEKNERTSFRMIKVKARGNESLEQMLRRFKKMCEKEGLTKEIKRTAYYEKPSERRRLRIRKSVKRVDRPMGR